MGSPTEFIPFEGSAYQPRYEFDIANRQIRDTKFHRDLVAGGRRGSRPHYRLVNNEGQTTHVRAEDIFGPEANEDISVDSDFEPSDFADRYTFDFETPEVTRKKGKGPRSGEPMTLLAPNGWKHWLLTRNDGVRVRVTPAEVLKSAQRDVWEVPKPRGSKVFKGLFPDHAFTKDGKVFRIRSVDPLLSPEPVPLDEIPEPGSRTPDKDSVYKLVSKSKQTHRFTRESIKALFIKKP